MTLQGIQDFQSLNLKESEINNSLHIPGTFIVIEGLDGAGTSTQISMLANWLKNHGINVIPTKEPTEDGVWGSLIRSILRREIRVDPLSLCHAFMADRVDHLQRLQRKASKLQSPVVLSDRYQLSYLAYQQYDTNRSFDWLFETQAGLPWPDITFYLNVPAKICMDRMKKSRTTLELFENLETLERIRESYIAAANLIRERGQRIDIIDGTRKIELVHKDILATTLTMLNKQ